MAEDEDSKKATNINVALRIRPMNSREIERGAANILSLSGHTVTVENPERQQTKEFQIENIYDRETTQEEIFNSIGKDFVQNAFNGFNCSAIAYGQTGTGKTFSMLGIREQTDLRGLAPRVIEGIFDEAERRIAEEIHCQVEISVLEIYLERINDLLAETPTQKQLRPRYTLQGEVLVENLTWKTLTDVADASSTIDSALTRRIIAATKMNAVSSRSHLIIGINLEQTNIRTKVVTKSMIQFADLAGSERISKTGATAETLREAMSINKSLSSLLEVVVALGENSKFVPYRNSLLTMLLRNALGGNSRTTVLGTVSPADLNLDETNATLLVLKKLKAVKNQTKASKTDTNELISSYEKVKERLLQELQQVKAEFGDTDEKVVQIEENIKQKESKINEIKQRLTGEKISTGKDISKDEVKKEKQHFDSVPYILNLHEDSSLSGKVSYSIKEDSPLVIGNPRSSTAEKPDVILLGPSIQRKHATLQIKDDIVTVIPYGGDVHVNGRKIRDKESYQLNHNDRIMFGGNSLGLFVFKHPKQEAEQKAQDRIIENVTFDYAQREIARYADVEIYLSSGDIFLKEQIVKLEQTVNEANGMAKELNRPVTFDVILISAVSLGEEKDMCHIFVQGWCNIDNKESEFLWSEGDFYDRFAMMSTVYGKFAEAPESSKDQAQEDAAEDPFIEPPDSSTIIGVAFVPLLNLANMNKTEDKYSISSTKTNGYINVLVTPCNAEGKEINEYIDPMNLLGHELNFKIKITQASDLPTKYSQTWCQYSFYMDAEDIQTETKSGQNPNYNFCKQYKQTNVTQNFLDYLETSQLIILVFGKEQHLSIGEESGNEDVEALREKIKELRIRKKIKHDKLRQKKAELRILKEVVKEKEAMLQSVVEKLKDSNDPKVKEVLEMLKSKT